MNSVSSRPSKSLNVTTRGIVDSPTPTVGTSLDSMRVMSALLDRFLARNAADVQPAVPPPAITIRVFLGFIGFGSRAKTDLADGALIHRLTAAANLGPLVARVRIAKRRKSLCTYRAILWDFRSTRFCSLGSEAMTINSGSSQPW